MFNLKYILFILVNYISIRNSRLNFLSGYSDVGINIVFWNNGL